MEHYQITLSLTDTMKRINLNKKNAMTIIKDFVQKSTNHLIASINTIKSNSLMIKNLMKWQLIRRLINF